LTTNETLEAKIRELAAANAALEVSLAESREQRAQERLTIREQQLRVVMEHTGDVIWTTDAAGNFNFVTPSIERVFGYTVEESLTHGILQINTPESLPIAAAKLDAVIMHVLTGQRIMPDTFELTNVRKDGTPITVEITLNGMYDNNGTFLGVVGITRDITARKAAEEAREELLQKLQQTLAELRTLQGIIPICSSCKKIRDDQGAWHQIEVYVRNHTNADFSHGLCPECIQKMYPGYTNSND